jgi:hypothetical protein
MILLGDLDYYRRNLKSILSDIKGYDEAYTLIFKNLNDDIKNAIFLVDAFYSDWLSKKGGGIVYNLTNKIISDYLNYHNVIRGVMLRSVEYDGGFNYILKKEAYDYLIEPKSSTAAFVHRDYGYGFYYIIGCCEASFDKGTPKWADNPDFELLSSSALPAETIRSIIQV